MKKTSFTKNVILIIGVFSLLFSSVVYRLSESILFAVLINFLVMNLYIVFLKRNLLPQRELIIMVLWISAYSINSCLAVIILINYVMSTNTFLFISLISIIFFINLLVIISTKFFSKYLTPENNVDYKNQALKLTLIYFLFLIAKVLISGFWCDALCANWEPEGLIINTVVIDIVVSAIICQVIYIIFKKEVNKLLYYSLIVPHIFIPYDDYFYLCFLGLLYLFGN